MMDLSLATEQKTHLAPEQTRNLTMRPNISMGARLMTNALFLRQVYGEVADPGAEACAPIVRALRRRSSIAAPLQLSPPIDREAISSKPIPE